MAVLQTIGRTIAERFRLWLGIAFGFVALYYAALLAALVMRFGDLPNYVTFYNWPANVAHIIRSTPSVQDMLAIVRDEWLVEIGYFNTDFGHGISEWSLTLIPSKMAVIAALGALIATAVILTRNARRCGRATLRGSAAAGGLGSAMVAAGGVTLFWVVCCSTPSWVVGLAMLGVGVSTSLWLEPLGGWLTGGGFALLLGAVYALARAAGEDAAAANARRESGKGRAQYAA